MSGKSAIAMIIIAIMMFLLGSVIGYEAGEKTVKTETMTTTYTIISYGGNLSQARSIIIAGLRQPIMVGTWRITVLNVNESIYIKERVYQGQNYSWDYYKAPPGMKAVVVRIKFENVGDYETSLYELNRYPGPLIVTDNNRSYNMIEGSDFYRLLEEIPSRSFAEKIDPLSVEFSRKLLFMGARVEPGKFVEGDLLFLVPQLERPIEMIMCYSPMAERYGLKLIIVVKLEQS